MSRLIFGTIIFAGLTLAPAMAADIPLKARPPATAPSYNWTGWYVGGHAGGGLSSNDFININGNPAFPAGTQHSTDQKGWLAGVQGGFNYQFNQRWVAGIEAEYSWARLIGNNARFSDVPGLTTSRLATTRSEADALGSISGRIGYALNNWLLYAKGGFAWLHKSETTNTTDPTAGNLLRTTASGGETRKGWLVGAGSEWGFSKNLSLKIEYDYMDFGTATETRYPTYLVGTGSNPLLRNNTVHTHLVTVGINYRFD
jgi:outer membrane immunogenic protein